MPACERIALRAATASDTYFAERVYFETQRWIIERLFGRRGDEIERATFLLHYAPERAHVIVADDQDAGFIQVLQTYSYIELEDIYITAAFQRQGIGTAIISRLAASASAEGKPLRLSTAKINPARALYERLGFYVTGEDQYKVYMERPVPDGAKA
jgi:ribosomal protein S18 acetylase RimI-like enzyme